MQEAKVEFDLDDQITKIGVRLGDIKPSELETRYQQVENTIRIHHTRVQEP